MISSDDIKTLILAELQDAVVLLEDLTGGEDHWSAVVISDVFAEMNQVKQHRRVYHALREPLKGPLHALQLRTLTKDRAREEGLLEE